MVLSFYLMSPWTIRMVHIIAVQKVVAVDNFRRSEANATINAHNATAVGIDVSRGGGIEARIMGTSPGPNAIPLAPITQSCQEFGIHLRIDTLPRHQ